MLSLYRVLDLSDGGALICGQILGALDADVILVEPPGGAKAAILDLFR
jgi:crotonobetainyl-CoA:carnitine CoA-transferase CaiB-like acyl-CoA transferase